MGELRSICRELTGLGTYGVYTMFVQLTQQLKRCNSAQTSSLPGMHTSVRFEHPGQFRFQYNSVSSSDFGGCFNEFSRQLGLKTVKAIDFGHCPLVVIIQTIDFGDCIMIGIVRNNCVSDYLY